jgi:hypothetical protein
MGAGMSAWSVVLVRWWTRAYTCGLPRQVRDARRAEIESDLWESAHDASEAAAQILPRLAFGIVDDLRWRVGLLDAHSRDMVGRLSVGVLGLVALWQVAVTAHLGPRLLESAWAYPLVESLHVLALTVFLGLTVMLDIRLMGASLRRVPVSELVETVAPWTATGAFIAIATGILTFLSDPDRWAGNGLFRLKIAVMAIALVNSVVFHLVVYARVREWEHDEVPPRAVRLAAGVSVTLWSVVVVCGRLLAYRWS